MRTLTLLLTVLALAAAEDALSGVDDPLGLGERLALIAWLQEHGAPPPAGTTLDELRSRYRQRQGPGPRDHAAAAREAAALELWRRHGKAAQPDEDAAAIRARLAALDAEAEARRRDEAAWADGRARDLAAAPAPAQAPAAAPSRPHRAPAAARTAESPAPPAATAPASRDLAAMRTIPPPPDMTARVRALLISPGSSPILMVVCDPDIAGPIELAMASWPAEDRLRAGVTGTVIIHGHSDGAYFTAGVFKAGTTGTDLSDHLRRNRAWYESMAGTRPEQKVDLAVMTGCNPTGVNQEVELRDGFGYRPPRRVFTEPRCLDAAPCVIAAIQAVGSAPDPGRDGFRRRYRWPKKMAGLDGALRSVSCLAVVGFEALGPNDAVETWNVDYAGARRE